MIQFNFSQDLDFKIYLSQCVESYVEKKIECRLSEHQNATDHVVRKCQSKEDLDNFQLEMEKLDSFKSINKITGCKPKCQTERFELRQTWSIARNKSTLSVEDQENTNILITIYNDQKLVEVEEELEIYSPCLMIGDIGGTLGLFLGYSILTLYETLIKRRTKEGQVQEVQPPRFVKPIQN